MDAKTVTYLPNMYEMINSSAYQIATDTTDAHYEAANSSSTAFGSRVRSRHQKENIFWRTTAAIAGLVIAIKCRKGIGKALKAVFKPLGKGIKNAFNWLSRVKISVKPKVKPTPPGPKPNPPSMKALLQNNPRY